MEMLVGLGNQVAGFFVQKLLEPLWELATEPVILVYNWKNNVANLDDQVEALKQKQEDVELTIEEYERTGQVPSRHQTWLTKTEKIIQAATKDEDLDLDKEKAKMKCFCGLSRNPVSLYKLSKKAKENAESIDGHLKEAEEKLSLPTVHALAPVQRAAASPVPGFQDFPSRKGILEKIMLELQSTRVNKIGLHGMAGSGKSMMVKEVRRRAEEEKMFERVVLVKVTMKPDLKRIREELARGLGMTQLSAELTSRQVIDKIEAKLQILAEKGKVLFVLDDVWEKIDLEEIGVSFPETDQSGEECFKWKILFTSRDRNVYYDDIGAEQVFAIGKIKPLEAKKMFMEIVGEKSLADADELVERIIEECGRLPLAIATLANALRGRDLPEWRSALTKLRSPSPHNFSGVSRSIYAAIEMSYNHLESNELKQLFLLSGMLGPNFSLEILLKYGIGLGLFPQAYTIEEAQADLLTLINHLKDASLLIEGSGGGGNSFDMHDITRDVAISIARKDHDGLLLKENHEPKEWYDKKAMKCFRWILLQKSDINRLPDKLESSNLVFFGVLNKTPSFKIPEDLFIGMPELRVLHLTQMDLSPLPSSICFLKNLHSLSLEQSKFKDLSSIGELECLEILNLSGSDFEVLPKEIGQLTRLQSLDLSDCDNLEVIAPHVLGRLSKLEELYLANSFVKWEYEEHRGGDGQERASLAELKILKKLVVLEVCIGDIQMIPTGLLFENLKKYKIYIGDHVAENHVDDYFDSSRMVKLQLNTSGLNVDYSVKEQLFNKTEELYLEGLSHVENVIDELYDEGFQHLKYLSVKNAPDVRHIIYSAEMFPLNAFPALEELFLHKLVCLDTVFQGWITKSSLTKLTKITVGFCERVQNLFSSSIARQLVQLQHIDVQHCDEMKEVVDDHEEQGRRHDIIAAEASSSRSLEFGEQLRSLRLQHLPKLVGFSRSCGSLTLFNDKVVNSKMEELMLFSIQVNTIWSLSSSFSVTSLVNLKIEGCNELKYLFSLSMARGLENLRFLRIRDCEKMEKIIFTQNGEDEEGKKNLSFLKLESLYISGLPELVGFYEGSCSIKFPSLKEMNISNCHKMKGFIGNPTPTDEDALFFNEEVEFSILESMHLNRLKCLTMIWHHQHFKKRFGNLKKLVVMYCRKLKTVFPSIDMLETSLEEVVILGCKSIQVVFELGELNVDTSSSQTVQLKRLIIEELPSLKHVWNKDPRGMISFRNLEKVVVGLCPKIKHVFPESIAINLVQLQELCIYKDTGMEEIVASGSDPGEVVKFEFPRLTSLSLGELSSLDCFYPGKHLIVWPMLKEFEFVRTFVSAKKKRQTDDDGLGGGGKLDFPVDLPLFPLRQVIHRLRKLSISEKDIMMISRREYKGDPFSNIKHLSIYNYSSLSFAFLIHFLQKFCSLEKLGVVNSTFSELFPSKGGHVEKFSKIKKLKLSQLPNLIHIWSQDSSNALPNLEDLEVNLCENLISLSALSKSSFWGNLTTLKVSYCKKMRNLVSTSTARNLTQLQAMTISFCVGLTQVVGVEEEEDGKQEVVFQKLRYLKLQGLTRMASFCSGKNVKFEFPSLKQVIVEQCPKLKTFCEGELSTPELDEVVSNKVENNSQWSSDLNITLHNMYTKEVGYAGLMNLDLAAFPKMIENWHSGNPHQKLDFERLERLEICNCNNLSYLLTTSMVLKLESLEKLVVENCGEIEQVIKGSEEAQDDQVMIITFPLLEMIELKGCSNLTSFYMGSDNGLNFPALYVFSTVDCPNLVTFAHFTSSGNHLAAEESQAHPFFGNKVVFPEIKSLHLKDMPRMNKIWEDELDAESFHLLSSVFVGCCSNLPNIFPFGMLERLQMLKRVKVYNCGLLGEILEYSQPGSQELLLLELNVIDLSNLPMLKSFCSGNSLEFSSDKEEAVLFDAKVSFPNLEILEINMLKSLNKIWDAKTDAHSFCKLNKLLMLNCEKLENVFPSNMLENDRLQSLGILWISGCSSIKEVFEPQSRDGTSEETIIKISLTSLTEVKLVELPELQCFSRQMYSIECPLLTDLEVYGCDQVKIFASEESYIQITDKENQQEIQAQWPLFWVNKATFSSIEELKLEYNDLMEEIWHGQNNQVNDDTVFSKLKSLKLNQLPKLASFCSSNRKFEFPTLEEVIVMGCPRLEFFSKQESLTLTPNVPSVKWVANEDHQGLWKGDLNATIQEMFTQKVGYSTLKKLNLSEYKEVIPIWNQNPQGILSFKMLTHLKVCNLNTLRYALTPPVALGLEQLVEFRVVNCEAIEQVIADIGEGSQGIMLPPKIELLELQDLPNLTSFCSGNSFEFLSLTRLKINKCPLLKTFISSSSNNTSQESTISSGKVEALFDAKVAFPVLEMLIIEFMENLNKICDDQLDANSFCQLDHIIVKGCNKMLHIFPLSMAGRLQTLNKLEILNCNSVVEIFGSSQSQFVMETPIKVVFPKLTSMILCMMPELKCFVPQIHNIECPSMKMLGVKKCDKIQILASEFQTLAQSAKEDNQLETSAKCSLFWVTKATFSSLEELILENNGLMEEIWHGHNNQAMSFSKMEILKLLDLPQLTSFGLGNSFEFPSLTQLEIIKCPLLKTFISSSTSQDLTVSFEKVDALFDAKVAFPVLKKLIVVVESLNKIWEDQLDGNSFCQLEYISVEACNKLSYIFPLSMVGRLQTLNKFEIWSCNSLVEIFGSNQSSQSHVMEITPIKLVFSNLISMDLYMLPKLKCFFPQMHTIECPSMKKLSLNGCDQIQTLASEFPIAAQSAEEDNQLEISAKCSLFCVTKATFPILEELGLHGNKSMEQIWCGGDRPRQYFPQLRNLKFDNLDEEAQVQPFISALNNS